jgi:hypothetical protein
LNNFQLKNRGGEGKSVEKKTFLNWDEFFEQLSKTTQELSEISAPISQKNISNAYYSPCDLDFLDQFS